MSQNLIVATRRVAGLLVVGALGAAMPARRGDPVPVSAKLSEWAIELSAATVPTGTVSFTVTNGGSIPHAFEVEGNGTERETPLIQPGASATLTLTLKPGTYEVYCPVGDNSHKKLGMDTHLKVGAAGRSGSGYQRGSASEQPTMREHGDTAEQDGTAAPAEPIG